MHGLIFETSIWYWQDQPGNYRSERKKDIILFFAFALYREKSKQSLCFPDPKLEWLILSGTLACCLSKGKHISISTLCNPHSGRLIDENNHCRYEIEKETKNLSLSILYTAESVFQRGNHPICKLRTQHCLGTWRDVLIHALVKTEKVLAFLQMCHRIYY